MTQKHMQVIEGVHIATGQQIFEVVSGHSYPHMAYYNYLATKEPA